MEPVNDIRLMYMCIYLLFINKIWEQEFHYTQKHFCLQHNLWKFKHSLLTISWLPTQFLKSSTQIFAPLSKITKRSQWAPSVFDCFIFRLMLFSVQSQVYCWKN